MRSLVRLFAAAAVVLLAGCQCGPGKACSVDATCVEAFGEGARCSSAGYCLSPGPETGGGGATGGGTPTGGGATGGGTEATGGGTQATGGGDPGDGGAPTLAFDASTLTFDETPCGAEVTRTLELQNPGGAPLHFTARSTLASFSVTPLAGTIGAGDSSSVEVKLRAPRGPANLALSGALELSSDAPNSPMVRVPLRAWTSGATVRVDPQLSFGTTTHPSVVRSLSFRNVGSAPVTLHASTSGVFSVSPADLSLDAGAMDSLEVTYSPAQTGAAAAPLTLSFTGALCDEPPGEVLLTGRSTAPGLELSTHDLYFGDNGWVACGTTPAARTVTLTNGTAQAFTWTAALPSSPQRFSVTPAAGTLTPGASADLEVTSLGVAATADTTPEAWSAVLTVSTDLSGDSSHLVALHQSAWGAVLRFNPTRIDFGSAPAGLAAHAPASVRNVGSAPVTVGLEVDSGVFFVERDVLVAPPGSTSFSVGWVPGDAGATAAVTMRADGGVLCAALPDALSLAGAPPSGTLGLDPIALDFGYVACGTQAVAQRLLLQNRSDHPVDFSTQLLADGASPFTVAPSSGTLAAAGNAMVTVTPRPVLNSAPLASNGLGDVLLVTVGDVTQRLSLYQTAYGSRLQVSNQQLSFGAQAVGSTSSADVPVTNEGNGPAVLKLSGLAAPFETEARLLIPAGQTVGLPVRYTAALGTSNDSLVFEQLEGPAQCGSTPGPVSVTGRGVSEPAVTLSTRAIIFGVGANGLVDCGSTAAPRSFTITNASSSNVTVDVSLEQGSAYQLMDAGTGTLTPASSRTVVVQPLAVPTDLLSTRTDALGDQVLVGVDGPAGHEDYPVKLTQTPRGAVLTFNPTSLNPQSGLLGIQGSEVPFVVHNEGNVDVTFSVAVTGNAFRLGAAPTSVPAGPGSDSSTGGLSCGSLSRPTGTMSLSVSDAPPLCHALPTANVQCN